MGLRVRVRVCARGYECRVFSDKQAPLQCALTRPAPRITFGVLLSFSSKIFDDGTRIGDDSFARRDVGWRETEREKFAHVGDGVSCLLGGRREASAVSRGSLWTAVRPLKAHLWTIGSV